MKTLCLFLLVASAVTVFAVDPPPGGGYPIQNTALGDDALFSQIITAQGNNTALGYQAMYSNTSGAYNTAVGSLALHDNTDGGENVAVGDLALTHTTTGIANVAVGEGALALNTTGGYNVAIGNEALFLAINPFDNVAIGDHALFAPTAGYNVAVGRLALGNAAAGGDNVAVGDMALTYCSGKKNIALGASAGDKITTGDHNIDIGNEGTATDNRIIRIGNRKTQRATYFAAINGVTVADGVPVIINALGQLGTATSSARYKEGIKPMNEASKPVLSLQPVTFRYKKELDPQAIPQFGLVAEDVAKVDPELVARDEEGKPYTVRYEAVNAMLLNEFLKKHQKVTDQNREIAQLRAAVTRLKATVEKVSAQLAPDQF